MSATQGVRERCIEECLDCTRLASECATTCLTGGRADAMSRCIGLCLDCATLTAACVELMARNSPSAGQVCGVCADLCDLCAEECERHGNGIMAQCAKACRHCTGTLRQMAAA